MGLWLPCLCTSFALSVADIQSLSHVLASIYRHMMFVRMQLVLKSYQRQDKTDRTPEVHCIVITSHISVSC